tara:strand:+ start:1613 stop:3019 length:1407 start_codon:yes stop_codon:yes gene_type:complete
MAETGGTTPDYSLDASTLAAVKEAGVDPKVKGAKTRLGKALGKLGPSGTARAALGQGKALADAGKEISDKTEEVVTAAKEKKQKKEDATADAEIKWDAVFDKMADQGSWASPELFEDFKADEEAFKTTYLEAVESGDKTAQQKALREQQARASSLAGWKKTMESAFKLSQDHELSDLLQGDSEMAVANREILEALANNGSGKASMRMRNIGSEDDPKQGEMVFDIEGLTGEGTQYPDGITSKDIDKLMTTAVSPVIREEGFAKISLAVENAAKEDPTAEFKVDEYMRSNQKTYATELRKNPEAAYSILHDTWAGGGTSLAEDLTEAIKGGAINFKINLPRGSELDKNGDGQVGLEEIPGYEDAMSGLEDTNDDGVVDSKDLDAESIEKLIKGIQDDPKLLAEVAGGWTTAKQEKIHNDATAAGKSAAFAAQVKGMPADVLKKKTDPDDPAYDEKFANAYSEYLAQYGV